MSRQGAGAWMAVAVPAPPAWLMPHLHHFPFNQAWTRSWRGNEDGAANPFSSWSPGEMNKLTAAGWECLTCTCAPIGPSCSRPQALDPNKVDAKSFLTHQTPMPANLRSIPLVNTEEPAMSMF